MIGLRPDAGLRRVASLVLTASLLLAAGASLAEGWTYDLAAELMSPYCPGRTLASCPSPQAAELVQWISTQEAAGVSRENVVEMLIERFGEEILGAPPAEGITLWAYVFPVAGFLLGGVVAAWALRRIVAGTRESAADVAPVVADAIDVAPTHVSDEELARRVDEDLARRA